MAVLTSKRLPAYSPARNPSRAHAPVILHLRFLSLPSPSRRRLVVISSSTSPSPLVEESPDELAGWSPKPTPSLMEAAPNDHQDARFRRGLPSSQPPDRAEAGISNGFIKGLAESPEMEALAYEYYQKARAKPGFRPDKQTLRPLVRYLLRCRQWDAIAALSEDFRAYGVLPDRAACDRLIRGCIKARKFRLTESLLGVFHEKQGATAAWAFGSAMRGYNKLHMYSSTLQVHEQMRTAGVLPDARCYFWAVG